MALYNCELFLDGYCGDVVKNLNVNMFLLLNHNQLKSSIFFVFLIFVTAPIFCDDQMSVVIQVPFSVDGFGIPQHNQDVNRFILTSLIHFCFRDCTIDV